MKVRKYWSAVTLSFLLLLGASSLLLAQEERRDEAKPQDEAKPNQPAPTRCEVAPAG
jgi:hypothetical protein